MIVHLEAHPDCLVVLKSAFELVPVGKQAKPQIFPHSVIYIEQVKIVDDPDSRTFITITSIDDNIYQIHKEKVAYILYGEAAVQAFTDFEKMFIRY